MKQFIPISYNGLRIREGYEAEPLAWGSFLLYAVIGCPFNKQLT